MLKTIFSRVLSKRKAAVLAVMALGILVLTAVAAVAQTYTTSTKPSLKLNKTSLVGTALTTLASNAAGPALTLRTDSTDPNATPLSLDTKTGEQAPMKVDSETKVEKLNAPKVDGKSSEDFMSGLTEQFDDGSLDSTDAKWNTAFCPEGAKVVGGGGQVREFFSFPGTPVSAVITASHPINSPGTGVPGNGWTVAAQEVSPTEFHWAIDVYALCVTSGF